jgi:hypothetical protein
VLTGAGAAILEQTLLAVAAGLARSRWACGGCTPTHRPPRRRDLRVWR